MLIEIPSDQIFHYRQHFSNPQLEMVLASIKAGNTGAQLWVNDHDPGSTFRMLWDQGNNVFYLSGSLKDETLRQQVKNLLGTQIRKDSLEMEAPYFRMGGDRDGLNELIPELIGTYLLGPTLKRFYSFPVIGNPNQSVPQLEGVEFARIDGDFLGNQQRDNLKAVKSEIQWMWTSLDQYIQEGFGVAALLGKEILCWCTAEYLSSESCGIGIETVEAYQGLGIASATAARFVEDSLHRGIQPHWECDANNPASIRVAEKVGFQLLEEKEFWVGRFHQSTTE